MLYHITLEQILDADKGVFVDRCEGTCFEIPKKGEKFLMCAEGWRGQPGFKMLETKRVLNIRNGVFLTEDFKEYRISISELTQE